MQHSRLNHSLKRMYRALPRNTPHTLAHATSGHAHDLFNNARLPCSGRSKNIYTLQMKNAPQRSTKAPTVPVNRLLSLSGSCRRTLQQSCIYFMHPLYAPSAVKVGKIFASLWVAGKCKVFTNLQEQERSDAGPSAGCLLSYLLQRA